MKKVTTDADWGRRRYHTAGNWMNDESLMGRKIREYDFRPGRSIPILGKTLQSNALVEERVTDAVGREPYLISGQRSNVALCCGRSFYNPDVNGCWIDYPRGQNPKPRLYKPFFRLRFSSDPGVDSWEMQFDRYVQDDTISIRGTAWLPKDDETRWRKYYDVIHEDVKSLRASVGRTLIQIAREQPVLLSQLNEIAIMYTLIDHYNDAQQPYGSDIPSYWNDGVDKWLDWIERRARKFVGKKGSFLKDRIISRDSFKQSIRNPSGLTPFSQTYTGLIAVGPKGWDTERNAKKARAARKLILQYGQDLRNQSANLAAYAKTVDPIEIIQRAQGMWNEWKRNMDSSEQQIKYSEEIGFALFIFLSFLENAGERETWDTYFPQSKEYFIISQIDRKLIVNLRALRWIRSSLSAESIDPPLKQLSLKDIQAIDAMFENAVQLVMNRVRSLRANMDLDFSLEQIREMLAFYPRRLLELMVAEWERFQQLQITDVNTQLSISDTFMHYTLAYFYVVGREHFNEQLGRELIPFFTTEEGQQTVFDRNLSQLRFKIGDRVGRDGSIRIITQEEIQSIANKLDNMLQNNVFAQEARIRNLRGQRDLKTQIRNRWAEFVEATDSNLITESKASLALVEVIITFFQNQASSEGFLSTLRHIPISGRIHLTKFPFTSIYQNENRIYIDQGTGNQITQEIEAMFEQEYYEAEMMEIDPDSPRQKEPQFSPRRRRPDIDVDVGELRRLLTQIANGRGNLQSFKEAAKRATKELDNAEKLRNETIPNLKGKVDIAQNYYDTLTSEQQSLKGEALASISLLIDERNRLRDIRDQQQRYVDDLNAQIDRINRTEGAVVGQELKKQSTTASQLLKKAQKELDDAKKKLKDVEAVRDAGDTKAINTAREKLKAAERNLANSQRELLDTEMDIIREVNEVIRLASNQLSADNDKWGQVLVELNSAVKRFTGDRSFVQRELEKTKDQLERLRQAQPRKRKPLPETPLPIPPPKRQTRKPLPQFPDISRPPTPDSPMDISPRDILEEREGTLRELERETSEMADSPSVTPQQFGRVRRLQQQDIELRDRLIQVYEGLNRTAKRLGGLEAKLDKQLALNQSLVDRINQLSSGDGEIDRLKQELQESRQNAASLQNQLDDANRAKEQADTLRNDKVAELEQANQDLEFAQADLERQGRQMDRMQAEEKQLRQQLTQKTQDLDNLRNQLAEASTDPSTGSNEQTAQLEGTIRTLEQEIDSLNGQNTILRAQVDQLTDLNDQFKANEAKLREEIEFAQADLERQGRQMDQVETRENQLLKELERARTETAAYVTFLNGATSILKNSGLPEQAIMRLQANLQNVLQRLRKDPGVTALQIFEQYALELNTRFLDAQDALQTEKSRVATLQQQLASSSDGETIRALQREIENINNAGTEVGALELLAGTFSRLLEIIRKTGMDEDPLQQAYVRLQRGFTELSTVQERVEQAQMAVQTAQEALQQQRNIVDQLKAEKESMEREIQRLTSTIESTPGQDEELRTELTELQRNFDFLVQKYGINRDGSSSVVNQLRRELEARQNEIVRLQETMAENSRVAAEEYRIIFNERDRLSMRVSELEQRIAQLNALNIQQGETIVGLRNLLDEAPSLDDVNILRLDLQAQLQKYAELELNYDMLDDSNRELDQQLQDARGVILEQDQSLQGLRREYEEQDAELEEANVLLEIRRKERNQIVEDITRLEAALADTQRRLRRPDIQTEDIVQELENYLETLTNLQSTFQLNNDSGIVLGTSTRKKSKR